MKFKSKWNHTDVKVIIVTFSCEILLIILRILGIRTYRSYSNSCIHIIIDAIQIEIKRKLFSPLNHYYYPKYYPTYYLQLFHVQIDTYLDIYLQEIIKYWNYQKHYLTMNRMIKQWTHTDFKKFCVNLWFKFVWPVAVIDQFSRKKK